MRSKRSKAWHRRKQAKYITRAILGNSRQCQWTRKFERGWNHCTRVEGHSGPHMDNEGVEFSSGKLLCRASDFVDYVTFSYKLSIEEKN